ncbi:MAG: CPBP family intramembrane metalloprotease [Erysipelotrichaceae bacterium]|nr:CPBP family intramembrane metalloprotease [Erysipelotrichaceae bacterium]
MIVKYAKKMPYLLAVLAALACVAFALLGNALLVLAGEQLTTYLPTNIAFLLSGIVFLVLVWKYKADFGVRLPVAMSFKVWLALIPVILMEIVSLVLAGVTPYLSAMPIIVLEMLGLSICIGINEEVWLRGFALTVLKEVGVKKAIVFSSVVFGVLHLANLDFSTNITPVLTQVFVAVFAGIVYAFIAYHSKSLLIPILFHAAHDFLGLISNPTDFDVQIMLLQAALLFISIVIFWRITFSKASDSQ